MRLIRLHPLYLVKFNTMKNKLIKKKGNGYENPLLNTTLYIYIHKI